MNTTQAYAEATGVAQRERDRTPPTPQSPAENEIIIQQKIDWIQHPCTQYLIKSLLKQAEECDKMARDAAIGVKLVHDGKGNVSLVDSSALINKQLVISATLRKVIEDYARTM